MRWEGHAAQSEVSLQRIQESKEAVNWEEIAAKGVWLLHLAKASDHDGICMLEVLELLGWSFED